MTTQPTCEELIASRLASRIADLRTMLDRDDPDEAPDDINAPGPLSEYAAGITVDRIYTIRAEWSGGGPADYLTATHDGDDLLEVTYHYADWGDHAERRLRDDDLDAATAYLNAVLALDEIDAYVSEP